jgi:very-short-patch-repair endonuclease
MTATEWRVWLRLRGKVLGGYKFRRQLAIGPYFADFVCLSARLVIEIDGPFHEDESDARKTAYLESQGFRVVRFPVGAVDEALDGVMDAIYWELQLPRA